MSILGGTGKEVPAGLPTLVLRAEFCSWKGPFKPFGLSGKLGF